jgi:hypothetical protein
MKMNLSVNIKKATFLYFLFFLSIFNSSSCGNSETHKHADKLPSANFLDSLKYIDITFFKDKFIAIGNNGRIDNFDKSGKRLSTDSSFNQTLNCACSNVGMIIIVGNQGTILSSVDGTKFQQRESGTNKNIYGVAFKNGLFVAGSENGQILSSKNGLEWAHQNTGAKGNIISVSANNSFFIGVTNNGEIIKSTDGMVWEIKDYNKEYAGYNKFSKFKKILATQKSIVIIGTHEDGSPSILFSSLGNVWSERIPFYDNEDGLQEYLTKEPNGIAYDYYDDQFILACNNGELFILPGCTKCNKSIKISEENLNALLCIDDNLYIVGDNFSVFVQNL